MTMSKPTGVVAFLLQLLLLHIQPHHQVVALQIFQRYGQPESTVSLIDLDQRSIVAKTALTTSSGLDQAKQIYESGRATTKDNGAPITLESLSTDPGVYRDFQLMKKFVDFYGGEQYYADKFIQAAFGRSNFQFSSTYTGSGGKRKSSNFMDLEIEGRSSAIRWGTLVLNVWMAVVSHIEKATTQCENSIDGARRDWNKAYAYYTGSLAEAEQPLGGYLLYSFAHLQCEQFGTCSKGKEAPINEDILTLFGSGRAQISGLSCADLKQSATKIQQLMTVPLVQATLRAAYSMDLEDDTRQETQGEAAVFAAALAPIVSNCSTGSADIIYNDLSPGNGPKGSYEVIKAALERNYDCMGITCAYVGGITGLNGQYMNRAEACGNVKPVPGAGGVAGYSSTSSTPSSSSSSTTTATTTTTTTTSSSSSGGTLNLNLALGLFISVVVGAAILTGILVFFTKPKMKEFDTHVDSSSAAGWGASPAGGASEPRLDA